MKQLFTIIGSGKFGTAMAHVLNENIKKFNLDWEIRCYDIKDDYKPNFCDFSTDLRDACFLNDYPECERHWLVTSIPAAQVENVVSRINSFDLIKPTLILVSKGVSKSGKFVSQLIKDEYQDKFELTTLVGPHFAADLMNNSPTITALGCPKHLESTLAKAFYSIKPIFNSDVLGIQIASVMKNMSAFCCGMAAGNGLSESTCGTVFALCMEDTKKLLKHFNCDEKLVSHPAILADWIMCCTSNTSRNFDAGYKHATKCEQECGLVESLKSIQSLTAQLEGKIQLPTLELVFNALNECNAEKHLKAFLNAHI